MSATTHVQQGLLHDYLLQTGMIDNCTEVLFVKVCHAADQHQKGIGKVVVRTKTVGTR